MKNKPAAELVEIIGIPGSGKSFVSKSIMKICKSNASLLSLNTSNLSIDNIVSNLNESYYWIVPADFLKFFPKTLAVRLFDLTVKYYVDNLVHKANPSIHLLLDFIDNALQDDFPFNERKQAFSTYVSRVYREIILNNHKKYVIEDGGFLFRSSYFASYACSLDTEMLSKYLKLIPYFPDKIIWVKVSPHMALERILIRKDSVVPYFLRGIDNYDQKIERLKLFNSNFEILFSMLPADSLIIEIDGNSDPLPILQKIFSS